MAAAVCYWSGQHTVANNKDDLLQSIQALTFHSDVQFSHNTGSEDHCHGNCHHIKFNTPHDITVRQMIYGPWQSLTTQRNWQLDFITTAAVANISL